MEQSFPKRPFRTHGGAHVPHHKNTAHTETRVMPPPDEITLPMTQHIGAPCVPCVKKGDHVYVGTKVADSDAYVSVPIHSSVSGTVKELADKYNMELKYMVGFLDGINESLKTPNPIEDMDENTQVSLDIDLEQLYYHMVEAKADWLYELPAWDELLTAERRKELYMEQKKSGTIVKEKKVGRNDPCPCGSGKKYKFCCGRA